ncbi:hypothetical protein OC842_003756 [Tilletia horrida]|uniref:Uncharacterized protein n=1 Tax=Tilletia horrida TaxID=155126 RepID=A0AAN6GCA1_9BASI|nr:hypothetical protein OC842_003756 [Tilletia horrida]
MGKWTENSSYNQTFYTHTNLDLPLPSFVLVLSQALSSADSNHTSSMQANPVRSIPVQSGGSVLSQGKPPPLPTYALKTFQQVNPTEVIGDTHVFKDVPINQNNFGFWDPSQVIDMVKSLPSTSLFIWDLRDLHDSADQKDERKKRKFKGALRLQPFGNHAEVEAVKFTWEKQFPTTEMTRLLNAEYVVVHCAVGTARSRAAFKFLIGELPKKTNRRTGQKVGLMQPGWDGFANDNSQYKVANAEAMAAFSVPL